ncbi:MAG: hypothetical protein V3S08_08300, partial [Phycisphaerales bacterium]
MDPTLGGFLARLEAAGELHRVSAPVSPILEIAEVALRHSKTPCKGASRSARDFDPGHCDLGGKAVLFESVEGSDFPVCINVFGSYRRMEMALGDPPGGFEAIAQRIADLTKPQPPRGLRDLLGRLRDLAPLLRTPPRRVKSGVCQ